ncbi:MAG: NADH-dependent alcohol dehydrogenase, partial [Acetatifactor sp.]|nr:NADH-dependent alcohol dehydrogenase [Acetatifactor sp.]
FDNPERTAREGIEALRSFLISIGMPRNFEELGAREEDIEKMAYTCCYGKGNESGKIGGLVPLNQKDVEEIYKLMI